MEMQIRAATAGDAQAVNAIYCHYVKHSVATFAEEDQSPSLADTENDMRRMTAAGWPYVVAADVSTGEVCGYAYANSFNDRAGYRYTMEDSIFIHPDHCGKGIGKSLLRCIVEELKRGGKRQVVAKIAIMPEQMMEDQASCGLHMALGFRAVGRLLQVGFKHGQVMDVAMLQLDLTGK